MRYLWVDSPDNPWWEAIDAHGITGLFFDPREARVTKSYLEQVAARGQHVGIYLGHAWGDFGTTPQSFVDKAVSWVKSLRKGNDFPRVQWDLEQHDPSFIARVLQLWRKVYPFQATSWTMEGAQGGLFDGKPELVDAIIRTRVRLSPQLFNGAMTEAWDSLAMTRDLTLRGFPAAAVSPCYDAGKLPGYWQGYAFTQGRLKL